MPIFGQVWLWSSLAFLLGALLCWLLVARPARNRVGELETQLASRARREPARPEPARFRDEAEFTRSLVPGLGDDDQLRSPYGLRDTPPLPPERDRLPEPNRDLNRDFAPMPPEREQGPYASGPAPDTELAEPPRAAAATQYLDVSAGSLTAPPEVPTMSPPPSDRGWFDDELHGDAANKAPEEQPAVPRNRHQLVEPELYDSRLVDDEAESDIGSALDGGGDEPRSAIEDDSGGTVFTQRTHPIPGELIRQIDEAGKAEQAETPVDANADDGFADDSFPNDSFPNDNLSDNFGDHLVDDLAEDPAEPEVDRRERTVESEPVAQPAAVEPEYSEEPPELPQEKTEVVAAITDTQEKPASDLPRRVPQQNRITPGVAVQVEPTPNALPKRVPGKPRHGVPFGVMPGSNPEPEPAAPAAAVVEDEPARSLFEPIVPAEDEGTATPLPPPHRLRQGSGGGRGPFGPGSAMPLPGGASPSPEFTIKASVAALRYCTPESPQFGRTVAEVWFRTAADAERVGFRPVG